ncbi:MAG: type II toxin-antitoxin system VapC family toxin [Candidatus Methanomethyliaceae archaeon]|nr:type II toxin-antitoxin system VapC family toxin [Candidatus Methanomethyliaceae archaeon]
MNLFDSSSVIVLCGERRLEVLLDGYTTDLAYYELGNAVWKQVNLYRKISKTDAEKVLESLYEVFRNLKKIEIGGALETLNIAIKENITYYDASYINAAAKNNLTLVTEDLQLLKTASRYTKTITSQQL